MIYVVVVVTPFIVITHLLSTFMVVYVQFYDRLLMQMPSDGICSWKTLYCHQYQTVGRLNYVCQRIFKVFSDVPIRRYLQVTIIKSHSLT